ncbi:MAG: type II toxin-antitoxin system PemK/MazF family toxin [Betaproteobacteria bacterium]
MANYERFDVVRVPFPFTDREAERNRPVLVISDGVAFNRPAGHSVMAMITSAGHAPWPLDVPIGDLEAAGLPAPSILRFKVFTLDHRLVRGKLGRLAGKDQVKVQKAMRRLLP